MHIWREICGEHRRGKVRNEEHFFFSFFFSYVTLMAARGQIAILRISKLNSYIVQHNVYCRNFVEASSLLLHFPSNLRPKFKKKQYTKTQTCSVRCSFVLQICGIIKHFGWSYSSICLSNEQHCSSVISKVEPRTS